MGSKGFTPVQRGERGGHKGPTLRDKRYGAETPPRGTMVPTQRQESDEREGARRER